MRHGVLLPLPAAVAPQPDVRPGPAPASPPHLRRERCLHAVRLQWRTWRRWGLPFCLCSKAFFFRLFHPYRKSQMNTPECVVTPNTLTLLLKMQRRSKRALAVVPTSWRPMTAAVTVWTALCVPVSSAGCVCRRSPTCTTSGTRLTTTLTYQSKCRQLTKPCSFTYLENRNNLWILLSRWWWCYMISNWIYFDATKGTRK